MHIINCILLVLFLLVSVALLKCTNFPLVINFLNLDQLLHLPVLLIIILPASSMILFHPQHLKITLTKTLFLFCSVSEIKNANLSRKCLVSYDVTSLFANIPLQETIDIAINIIFNHNPNLNITKKKNLKTFLFCYITYSIYF